MSDASQRGPVLLEVAGLSAGYGQIRILDSVSFEVRVGEIVALLGSNGAGKTTLNNAIAGTCRRFAGTVRFEGADISSALPEAVVDRGLIHVPEGRKIFPNLSVQENLELGSYRRGRQNRAQNLEIVFDTFPRLRERSMQYAGSLSGGEQQMLAIGRALMSRPRVLLMDEPSMGVAPLIVKKIFETISELNRSGMTILLVEQNAHLALGIASRGYVLETGEIALEDAASNLLADPRVREAYLGD